MEDVLTLLLFAPPGSDPAACGFALTACGLALASPPLG
jgi:hypothetical protein